MNFDGTCTAHITSGHIAISNPAPVTGTLLIQPKIVTCELIATMPTSRKLGAQEISERALSTETFSPEQYQPSQSYQHYYLGPRYARSARSLRSKADDLAASAAAKPTMRTGGSRNTSPSTGPQQKNLSLASKRIPVAFKLPRTPSLPRSRYPCEGSFTSFSPATLAVA